MTHTWQLRFIYFCSLPILSLRLDQALALDRATVFGALQFDLIFQLLCEATACLPQSAHPHRCNEFLLIFFLGVLRISQHWSWHEVHGHNLFEFRFVTCHVYVISCQPLRCFSSVTLFSWLDGFWMLRTRACALSSVPKFCHVTTVGAECCIQ